MSKSKYNRETFPMLAEKFAKEGMMYIALEMNGMIALIILIFHLKIVGNT